MFNRKQRRHTVIDTLVGANSKIKGDLHFDGGCHVDGTVKGNITADPDTESALSISDVGNVDGGVTVPYVVLNGIVKGDVFANRRVELGATARVIGNVYYNLIQMAEGAEINGKLVHQPEGQVPLLEQTTRIDEKAAASGE
ncbi:MAG: polymer-forming cytoskeletal protein [Proteobacteria bacterium]|nr:polymer-forming cytoskeletal protein [Pseudomonadota bacterium]